MAKLPVSVKLGSFQLGMRWVDVFADKSRDGGNVWFTPKDKNNAKMVIGLDDNWGEVLATLIHETMECAFVDMQCQYVNYGQWSEGTGNRCFMLDHSKFDEATVRSGWFMSKVTPLLAKAYRSRNAKPKKLTRRK